MTQKELPKIVQLTLTEEEAALTSDAILFLVSLISRAPKEFETMSKMIADSIVNRIYTKETAKKLIKKIGMIADTFLAEEENG